MIDLAGTFPGAIYLCLPAHHTSWLSLCEIVTSGKCQVHSNYHQEDVLLNISHEDQAVTWKYLTTWGCCSLASVDTSRMSLE